MKILVCTDGSKQSQKALEEASKIAGGCNADELAVIHVFQPTMILYNEATSMSQIEHIKQVEEQEKEERKKILAEALKFLEGKTIGAKAIFEEGHPSETITRVAKEGGYDMIVMGSRGMGGLKKLLLGSVSAAVVQEAAVNVLTVK